MLFCLSPAQAYGGLHKPEDMCEKDRLLAETISLYDQYSEQLALLHNCARRQSLSNGLLLQSGCFSMTWRRESYTESSTASSSTISTQQKNFAFWKATQKTF